MATNRLRYTFQLYDQNHKAIQSSGGVVYVAASGDAAKQAITDKDGTALANPRALTRGACEFYVVDTAVDVDLYIMAPGGQFIVQTDFVAGETPDLMVDTNRRNQVAVIPFAIGDTTAAAETDTGFDFPTASAVLPNPMVRVTTADATETIDVGLLSSESGGDADGFINALDVASAVLVKATLLASGDTMGALLSVLDSANAGDDAPEAHIVTGAAATSITYTLTAGTDTAEGFILLSYILGGA